MSNKMPPKENLRIFRVTKDGIVVAGLYAKGNIITGTSDLLTHYRGMDVDRALNKLWGDGYEFDELENPPGLTKKEQNNG